jgi:predicted O-linked N-acetylglucosamine transferase (SPINDLY family)
LCGLPNPSPCPFETNGCITFGSFNNLLKVSAATVQLWVAVLRQMPRSRLLLKSSLNVDRAAEERLVRMLAAESIEPARICILPRQKNLLEHLMCYTLVDVALDTFPYNGVTTTCEALMMGVPVVSLAGQTPAARVGRSVLSNAGFNELVARTPEEFVCRAATLAQDSARLRELRQTMGRRLFGSQLMDGQAFMRDFETAVEGAFDAHVAQGDCLNSGFTRA